MGLTDVKLCIGLLQRAILIKIFTITLHMMRFNVNLKKKDKDLDILIFCPEPCFATWTLPDELLQIYLNFRHF